jgi:hypothetical protein
LKALLLTARQQFSHHYPKREGVATLAIPKDSSVKRIVVDFAETLAGGPHMVLSA